MTRLASALIVKALLRLAESQGGFGTVLAKGDEGAGAIGVVMLEKGANPSFFERILGVNGDYAWQARLQGAENAADFAEFLRRRRKMDPDLWLIELDVACAERFAAEMNALC